MLILREIRHMEAKKYENTFSLAQAAAWDAKKNLRAVLTGWGAVCKARTKDDSRAQIRKRNRKAKA